jgi:hypothetical protein
VQFVKIFFALINVLCVYNLFYSPMVMHLVILQEPPLEIIEGKKEKQKNPIRSYSSPQMECKYNSFLINMAVKSKSLEHV